MGFLDKIKNALNIGGVKIILEAPNEIKRNDGVVKGRLIFSTKTDKKVTKFRIKLEETWQKGKSDNKIVKTYNWGEKEFPETFELKVGEEKIFDFELPFTPVNSNNDELRQSGGVLGGLGKVGSLMSNEMSTYFLIANADIENGGIISPNAVKKIKISF